MAVALVSGQTAAAEPANGTSGTISLPNTPTTNNLVVCGVAFAGSGSVITTTVADANSNAYGRVGSGAHSASNIQFVEIFYLIAPASPNKQLNITFSASVSFIDLWAAEYSGFSTLSPLETSITALVTSTSTAINSPTITPTNNGDLLFAVVCPSQNIQTSNSPWTGIGTYPRPNGSGCQYLIQTTAGAQAISFTQSPAGSWTALAAAFNATRRPQFPDAPGRLMMGVGI